MTADDLATVLAALPSAQRRLEQTLAELTDDEARGASALPGWTRGHVVTHLARNAEAIIRLATGALTGTPAELYPGGDARRNADIEAGAGRPADALVTDVMRADAAVEEAFAAMTPEAWTRTVRFRQTELPASYCAWGRWREVEVHHADLALTRYTIRDWPSEFVAAYLSHELAELADRLPPDRAVEVNGVAYGSGAWMDTVDGPDAAVLAWLVGRPALAAPHLTTPGGELPQLSPWG